MPDSPYARIVRSHLEALFHAPPRTWPLGWGAPPGGTGWPCGPSARPVT